MKQKLTATLLLLMAGLLTLSAQINFSVSYKRVDAKTIDIIFSGTAAPGWHIYSMTEGTPQQAAEDALEAVMLKIISTARHRETSFLDILCPSSFLIK